MTQTPLIILHDTQLDFLGLARYLKDEDYPFIYCNLSTADEFKQTGQGMLDKSWSEHFWRYILRNKPEDVIIVTPDNGTPHMFDFLRRSGYSIIGEGDFANRIEYERSTGTELFTNLGFEVPETEVFDSINAAIKYLEGVKDQKERYVVKPEGSRSAGGSRTYSGRDIPDVILFLKWLKMDLDKKNEKIEKIDLQKFIDGYEADFSRWFNGKDYIDGLCVDIEEKKIGEGKGSGFAEGCATNIVFYVKSSPFNKYFEKLKPYLVKAGYIGDVAINCIFAKSDGQPRPLEWTLRMGWDSFPTEMAMHKAAGKKVSDFLLALSSRRKYEFPYEMMGFGVRVHCMSPKIEKKEIADRFFTFDESIKDNFYLYCASKTDNYYLVNDNAVGVLTAVAPTYKQVVKKLYDEVAPKLFLSDAFYRSTPPARTEETISFLMKHKWI